MHAPRAAGALLGGVLRRLGMQWTVRAAVQRLAHAMPARCSPCCAAVVPRMLPHKCRLLTAPSVCTK